MSENDSMVLEKASHVPFTAVVSYRNGITAVTSFASLRFYITTPKGNIQIISFGLSYFLGIVPSLSGLRLWPSEAEQISFV